MVVAGAFDIDDGLTGAGCRGGGGGGGSRIAVGVFGFAVNVGVRVVACSLITKTGFENAIPRTVASTMKERRDIAFTCKRKRLDSEIEAIEEVR